MKKLATVVSDLRLHTMLCCSAAVLLTACGGSAPETGNATQSPMAAPSASVDTEQPVATLATPLADATPADDVAAFSTVLDDVAPASEAPATRLDGAPQQLAMMDTGNVSPAAATIYHLYVSTSGNDAASGSISAPFRTIGRAARAVKPSTTVHVAAGTYRENIKTTIHGTATARIQYVSDTKWGAKIIGSGTEILWTNNANYTDIRGFEMSGSGRIGVGNFASYTIVASNYIHHMMVSGGCTGSGGAGVVNANYNSSDGDIVGNVIHDIGVPGKCNGVQGIYSANLRGKIMNNIVFRASAWGIHLWHAADNVLIANNTVFANGTSSMGGGMMLGVGDSPGGRVLNNTRTINNIVYKNPAYGIRQYCYSGQNCIGSTNTTANNLVFGNGTNVTMRVGSATGTVAADPQFVSYVVGPTGNFTLRSTSPAVNRGSATGAPSYDFNMVARPKGGAHDIGAYENF